jgi:hypothetical protein
MNIGIDFGKLEISRWQQIRMCKLLHRFGTY